MIESELYYLVKSYRDAIEQAHKKNRFCKWPFNQFPEACCGQASDILARFLGEQGIYTKVVSGSDSNTTHAWLVLDDSILQKNIQRAEEATDYEEVNKMNRILEGYGYNKEINIYPYCDLDSILRGCTIIDITGSQSQFRLDSKYFNYNIPIYIGEMDDFHNLFRFLYKGIIIKHNKTEPTYTKTSLFLCEKRRFLWPGLRKEGNLFKLAGPGGLAFFHLTKKEVSKWPMKK